MSIFPKSQALKISTQVDYQDGSVVSHQITKAAGGNVTLFAFDEGQELSEHTAPYDAFVHVLDGEAEIRVSGEAYHLQAGDGIIMPSNEPHSVMALKKFKMLLTMIHY